MANLDLTRLLDPQYRNKTLDTLIKSLFNRQLTKTDTVQLHGLVGDTKALGVGEVKIQEQTLERQINQLTPVIYSNHGTETITTTWADLVNQLSGLGIDTNKLDEWLRSDSYNFTPPIDYDKFCNFNQYFWIGQWVQVAPHLPYHELGLAPSAQIDPIMQRSNAAYSREYYVIKRGALDSNHQPIATLPTYNTWSDWSFCNLWVHRDDVIGFLNDYAGVINFSMLEQAVRPIIEYDDRLKLNTFIDTDGAPNDHGSMVFQVKSQVNQLPLFDLYDHYDQHLNVASSIFYYQESGSSKVDAELNRRVVVNLDNDFIFAHALYNEQTKALRFYKILNVDTGEYELRTIWRRGPEDNAKYVKYDVSGTLINQDKFKNFSSYYWVGVDHQNQPSFNSVGLPEYVVIEPGGTSAWSTYNYWVHVSQLRRSDLPKYVQATKPIIEFNVLLESSLLEPKTSIYQLPRFTQYAYDQPTSSYVPIPYAGAHNLTDAYLNGALFARVDELKTKSAIMSTTELVDMTFDYAGETFVQGLQTGVFIPEKNGVNYGYHLREVEFNGVNRGVFTVQTMHAIAETQVLFLDAIDDTTMMVHGTVSGQLPPLTVGQPYTAAGATFTIFPSNFGRVTAGDHYTLELKSYAWEPRSLFVKLDNVYRTVTSPSAFMTERVTNLVVPADTSLKNGTWQAPPQLIGNVTNETRVEIGQGDLYYHMISVIAAQPLLLGSASGINNWRYIQSTIDYGLGGTIKQHDGNFALLISLLQQEGLTVSSLLDFARSSYENLFKSIRTFVHDQVPTLLTNGEFLAPASGDSIDDRLVNLFIDYFSNLSPVVVQSENVVDDYVASPFYDTTSSFGNLVLTLPYLGLADKVSPTKLIDYELNLPMIRHHDGHVSAMPTVAVDLLRAVVNMYFKRSSGNETQGVIAPVPPANPYRGQFWFKVNSGELFYFQVVSDSGEQRLDVPEGSYSYNRQTKELSRFTTNQWVAASVNDAWHPVKLDLIEANLTLAIEKWLFERCPPVSQRLTNAAVLKQHADYDQLMSRELENFGVTYGVTDVYSTAYEPNNPFTWNYSSAIIPGTTQSHATWYDIYRDVYGTARPDLEPWASTGFNSEAEFLDALVMAGIDIGDKFTIDKWPTIQEFVRSYQVINGRVIKLSVDVNSGSLLPPSSDHIEGLGVPPPASANTLFKFNDHGPVEAYWRKTLNFLYSEQKVFFKLDPLSWVRETWGDRYLTVGGYTLRQSLGNKEAPSDFRLHGDPLTTSPSVEWFTNSLAILSTPMVNTTYEFRGVNFVDQLIQVTNNQNEQVFFVKYGDIFNDGIISLTLEIGPRGLYSGECFYVTVTTDGNLNTKMAYTNKLAIDGMNQLYVQASRSSGSDLAVSVNKTLLQGWKAKLGYRFGGLINTDTVQVKINNQNVVSSSYEIVLKTNKRISDAWINAFRIQLVQRGTTSLEGGYVVPGESQNGPPGSDWVYRVDTYNPAMPTLTWYAYDESAEAETFVALSGSRTTLPWKRRKSISGVITHSAPFLITGIQNVADFILGYAHYKADEGWVINADGSLKDPLTSRQVDYQLLAEQFINQQFSGVTAGSAFLVNPFSRKVWFETARGFVSNVANSVGVYDQAVSSVVIDADQQQIGNDKLRVFREDDQTELVFDRPCHTLHLLIDELEHLIVFENRSIDTLIYDFYIGQRTDNLFFSGERQANFTGRLDFGGHFLLGSQLKRNIESSVQDILALYDTSSTIATPDERDRARALLGFQNKDYFALRGTTDQAEFRFWQGLIANKGANFSVKAFANSQKFTNVTLDEYWAYKMASYGDARPKDKIELKMEPSDPIGELTNYLLLEDDELTLLDLYRINGGYDMTDYEEIPYDVFSIYTSTIAEGLENFDPRSCVPISPTDEDRWFRYEDLRAFTYFEAKVVGSWLLTPTKLGHYTFHDADGKPTRADGFEVHYVDYIENNHGLDLSPFDTNPLDFPIFKLYSERGDYLPNPNPDDIIYTVPLFRRVNSSTIEITDEVLLGRQLRVVAYGPAISTYSPNLVYNYKDHVTVLDDIIWWDPARGSHRPDAYLNVDFEQSADPAAYNNAEHVSKWSSRQTNKAWGNNEVGKIWWNTKNLEYQLYSDSKVYPDFKERMARWGGTAEYSSIEVYEWVKSSVPPQDYERQSGTVEVAIKPLIRRERTWQQRPVAWKYAENPAVTARLFNAYQPSLLHLDLKPDNVGRIILDQGAFVDAGVIAGSKVAGAVYQLGKVKNDNTLTDVFGTLQVKNDPYFVVTTKNDPLSGPGFIHADDISFSIEFSEALFSGDLVDFYGEYVLTNEQDPTDEGRRYVTLTHTKTKRSQSIEVRDVPLKANSKDYYTFNDLEATLVITTITGRGTGTVEERKTRIAEAIGNPSHDIFLRSVADVKVIIPMTYELLFYPTMGTSDTAIGWITWNDPTVIYEDVIAPFHQYEPILGAWEDIGDALPSVADDLITRQDDPWVGPRGEDWNSYRSLWSPWREVVDRVTEQRYFPEEHTDSVDNFLDTFDLGDQWRRVELFDHVTVYINRVRVAKTRWTLTRDVNPKLRMLVDKLIKPGDIVRVQVDAYRATVEELEFDPSIDDSDPYKLTQWKYDYQFATSATRGVTGGQGSPDYFFWVKNKESAGAGKSMSVASITQKLRWHDGAFAVPQAFKYYNQLDGRPNRYALLSVRQLHRYVRLSNSYKMRLTRNATLRENDHNITLKNVHTEWKLLRQYQTEKVPQRLWNILTDGLAGQTELGQPLPYTGRESYDLRTGGRSRYGFVEQQQLFADPVLGRATVKHTLQNTGVTKYVNGVATPDFVNFSGFNMDRLDTYLSTPDAIRKFMSDLWRYAKPKQVNEVFFAVLEDVIAVNYELTDMFKTSLIALNDIRTINTKDA